MSYPASIEVRRPESIARWRPLVQWILAIPHLIIAGALSYVAGAVAIVTWFVVLFTGRLPAGLANFQVMILRYSTRVYLYSGFLYDEYPPFTFEMTTDDPGGSPVTLWVHPSLENRNRLTVGLRFIWVIPALLYAFVIWIVGALAWIGGFFAVIVTGRWPDGLWRWVLRFERVQIRVSAYAYMLTDEYPPFDTE
jgi:hypothetical protein